LYFRGHGGLATLEALPAIDPMSSTDPLPSRAVRRQRTRPEDPVAPDPVPTGSNPLIESANNCPAVQVSHFPSSERTVALDQQSDWQHSGRLPTSSTLDS
jgi:hypothetical protein